MNDPPHLLQCIGRALLLPCILVACNFGQEQQKQQIPTNSKPTSETTSRSGTSPLYQDRQAIRQLLRWPDDCENRFQNSGDGSKGFNLDELAPRRYLVRVACSLGAYQGSQIFYLMDQNSSPPSVQLLTFATYEEAEEPNSPLIRKQVSELWGVASFTGKAGQLTVLNKFRGPGDCGTWAVYTFADGTPKLQTFRAKLACDGEGWQDPSKWKKIVP